MSETRITCPKCTGLIEVCGCPECWSFGEFFRGCERCRFCGTVAVCNKCGYERGTPVPSYYYSDIQE